jgi:hypothetical protein
VAAGGGHRRPPGDEARGDRLLPKLVSAGEGPCLPPGAGVCGDGRPDGSLRCRRAPGGPADAGHDRAAADAVSAALRQGRRLPIGQRSAAAGVRALASRGCDRGTPRWPSVSPSWQSASRAGHVRPGCLVPDHGGVARLQPRCRARLRLPRVDRPLRQPHLDARLPDTLEPGLLRHRPGAVAPAPLVRLRGERHARQDCGGAFSGDRSRRR